MPDGPQPNLFGWTDFRSTRWTRHTGRPREDLTGRRFGHWTVVRYAGKSPNQNSAWLCRCDCGRKQIVWRSTLTCGKSTQCIACWNSRCAPFAALFNQLRRNARCRSLTCSITLEEFSAFARLHPACHYCTAPLLWAERSGRDTRHRTNADRKDNREGYAITNLVACCPRCNLGKSDKFSYREWWTMTQPYRDGVLCPLAFEPLAIPVPMDGPDLDRRRAPVGGGDTVVFSSESLPVLTARRLHAHAREIRIGGVA